MSEQYKVDVLIDVKARIDEAKEQFNDLLQQEDQLNENSNVRAALNEDVQRALAAIEYLEGMVNKIGSKDIGGRMVQEVMEGLKDIGTMGKLLQKGNNDFGLIGVNMAKSIFRNFEPEVQKQLNAMTPMMMNAIRTSFKRQSNTSSFAQMAAEMMSKTSNADWISTLNRNGVANRDIQKHLELLMAPALSLSRTAGYRSDRYGAISADRIRSTQEFLPVGLRSAWQNGTGYQRGEWVDRTDQSKQHMTAKAQRTLGDLISSNPAAWRAAERAGLLQHNGGKNYSLARNISPKLYDDFVSNIYDDFVRRAEGSPARHIGFYNQGLDEDTQIRLNNRMTSGTAGKAMDALWAAMDLRHVSSFGKSEPRKQVALANVPKRNLNQYETNKYTLADIMSGKFTNPQKVSINESTFTRMLEQIRGENIEHNSDISDAMIEVALGQYDENNADQKSYLKRIMKEGLKVGNQRYDLVNIHGTGFDTTGRFVRRSDREKIQNYYAEQVKDLGLSGDDAFRMFVDRNRKFKNFKEYARYLDATGKIFSPGAQGIDLSNYKYKDSKGNTQTGANFAFVKFMEDEEKLADGLAWVIDDLIPHEGEQSRFALAGKGMVHSLHGAKNIAEYARNAGILEEIMKRTGLSEEELENVHGLIDESSVKNLQAYENLKTPQARNKALTALTRLFGFGEMKSAESRTTDAEGLGRQVMQFLDVDPETLIKNAAAAANRIRFLQTDIGARSLINGSRNDVERQRLRTKGHEATSQEAQRMVDNEIASIIRRYSSGEWIEMNPDESSVRNMVLNESLVGAALLSGDKSPESIRKRLLGNAKIQANKDLVKQIQEMTDDELEGIFALKPGQGLDFTTNDKGEYADYVSILRNPTGAGQLIGKIKNYAKLGKPIYDAYGIPTVGAFLNLEDMKTLGDADFDGDTIKAIYGHLSDIMKASADKQEAMRKQLGDFETPQLVGAGFSVKGPFAHSSGTWLDYLSQAIKTGGFMGQQDTAAARAAALGLNDYQNMLIAFQASEGYAQATNALKEYKNVQKTKEEEEITGVGRPWVRYGGAFTTFLNTTGRDNLPIPSQENIYTSPKGIKINLDAMRAARLESMMAPSIHETSNLIAPLLASKLPGFAIDTSYADAVVSAFKYLHEDEDKQTPALAPAHEVRDMYQKMLAYRMVGALRFLSSEDETLFSDKALEAGRAISKYTQDVLAGNVMHPGATVENGNILLGGTKYSASSFENLLRKQNSIPQILGMINETGQTERNLERVFPGLLKDLKDPELFKSVFSNVGEYSFADTARASEQLKNVVGHSAAVNIAQQALMERIARPVSTLGRASSSVTSVEPWFVDQEGNSITLRGIQYSRGNDPLESVKDAPLYATRQKMMSARAQKEASLIRKIIEDPERPNADIEQGNLMHGVLEYAFNTLNNNKNADIKPSEILRSLLQGNNNNGTYMPTSKMAEALQVLKSEQYGVIDKDGNILDDGPAAGVSAAIKLSALLGNEENKGAIDRFFEHVRSRGKNSEYITEYAFDYIDDKIKEATKGYNDTSKPYAPYGQQRGTVRPDLIQINKDSGDVTLYDYKSSVGDAWKSIAQMSSYATMMNNMAKQYYAYEGRIKAGTFSKDDEDEWAYYESLKKKGAQRWGYYDDKGEYHSRIKRLVGANVPGGTERYELDLSTKAGQEFAESVQESYIEGIKQRADEASKGDREGRLKVLREYRKNIGVNEGSVMADALTDLIINESAKEMVQRSKESGEEIGLSPVLTQHAERDAETLAQIRSQLFKKQRQMGLMPETGFSQYTMMRNQIENEMMTEDQLTQMKAYYLSKNDMLSVEEMDKRQKEMRETRNWLNEMERKGVPSDLEYATKMVWKTAAEAKPGNTYDALSALDYRLKNAQAQVSGLQRPEFFSEGKWKDSEEAQEQKRAWDIANIEYENLKKQDAEARNYIKQKQEYNLESIKRRGNEIDFEQYMYQNQYGLNRLRESPRIPFLQNSLVVRNYENRLQQQIQRDQREYQLSRQIHQSYDNIRAEHELQMDLQSRIGKDTTKEQEDAINKDIEASQDRINNFSKSIEDAKTNLAQLEEDDKSDFGNALAAGFDTVTVSVERLVSRLGRQVLQKALTEAKQFVVQFSTEMSQIQAITMMSDEDMVGERARNISQAKQLHTSISNVAQTRASLYRQGLSGSEVDSRTEAIIKFATVTGTKVTNATKYLTTAIQNGLVDSVESAMDVLVALGDSAATTAEEISKGMQKSAAAAANAGVSFEELSTMLTITTSRTQLGGNVAGTAMQTLLSRMTRVTNGKALIDTNGEAISANKVEEALKSVGISLRDEKDSTKFKGSFDVLYELSTIWNDLNDLQRGNISYAMAGGRQVNMFQTLMEGFAEDNGAEMKRLMDLTEDSEGITDNKYALAINNINTSLTDLKNTFDGLVESLTSSGIIAGTIDWMSNLVSGFENMTNASGGVLTTLAAIGAAFAALTIKMGVAYTLQQGLTKGWVGLAVAGAAVTALIVGAGIIYGQSTKDDNKERENRKDYIDTLDSQIEKVDTKLGKIQNAKKAIEGLNDVSEAGNELKGTLKDLNINIDGLKSNKNWKNELGSQLDAIGEKAEKARDELQKLRKQEAKKELQDEFGDTWSEISSYQEQKTGNISVNSDVVAPKPNTWEGYFAPTTYLPNNAIVSLSRGKNLDQFITSLYGNGSNQIGGLASKEDVDAFRKLLIKDYEDNYLGEENADLYSYISGPDIGGMENFLSDISNYNRMSGSAKGLFRNYLKGLSKRRAQFAFDNAFADEMSNESVKDFTDYAVNMLYSDEDETTRNALARITKEAIDEWGPDVYAQGKDYVFGQIMQQMETNLQNARNEENVLPEDYPYYLRATDENGNVKNIPIKDIDEYLEGQSSGNIDYIKRNLYKGNATKGNGVPMYGTFGSTLDAIYRNLDLEGKLGYKKEYRQLNRLMRGNKIDNFQDLLVEGSGIENLSALAQKDTTLAVLYNQAKQGGQTEWDTLANYINQQANGGESATDIIGKNLSNEMGLRVQAGILQRMGTESLTKQDKQKIASEFGLSVEEYELSAGVLNELYKSRYRTNVNEYNQALIDYAKSNGYWNEETGTWTTTPENEEVLNYLKERLTTQSKKVDTDETGKSIYKDILTSNSHIGKNAIQSIGSLNYDSDILLSSDLRSVAQGALNARTKEAAEQAIKNAKGLDKADAYMEQLKSSYPELWKWLNMSEEEKGLPEGQNLERRIRIAIDMEGLQELEEAGQIIEGMSQNIAGMQSANKMTSFKASDAALTSVASAQIATSAIAKLQSGKTLTESEWTAIGNWTGTDMTGFKQGTRSISELTNLAADTRLMNEESASRAFRQEMNAANGDAGKIADIISKYERAGFTVNGKDLTMRTENLTTQELLGRQRLEREKVSTISDQARAFLLAAQSSDNVRELLQNGNFNDLMLQLDNEYEGLENLTDKDIIPLVTQYAEQRKSFGKTPTYGTSELRRLIQGYQSATDKEGYLNGLSLAEFDQLNSFAPELQQLANFVGTDEERGKLERQLQLKINFENVDTYNDVQNMLENLDKGGMFTVDIQVKMHQESSQFAKYGNAISALAGGATTLDQDQAIMDMIGWNSGEYYANQAAALKEARRIQAARARQDEEDFQKMFNEAADDEQRREIVDLIKRRGGKMQGSNVIFDNDYMENMDYYKEDPLDTLRKSFKPTELADYATQFLNVGENWEDMWKQFGKTEGLQQALINMDGFSEYILLMEKGATSGAEFAKSQRELAEAIVDIDIDELEKNGEILSSYVEALKAIDELSAEKREKGKYSGINTAAGYNTAMQAMNRINQGKATAEDWNAVGGYLGIDSTTLALYQSGALNYSDLQTSLTAMGGQATQGIEELMKRRALQQYNAEHGTNYTKVEDVITYGGIDEETGTLLDAQKFDWASMVNQNEWMDDYQKLGYRMENGKVTYDADLAAEVSAIDRYRAAKNIRANTGLSTDYTNAYKNAYALASSGQSVENIIEQLGEQLPLEFRDQLVEAEEAVAKGDANAVKRLAYNTAYGGGYGAGMYNINNQEVQGVLSTLLSGGNVNDLLTNNPELSSYMSNLLPNLEEYKNVLAQNKNLTEAQKNDIKQIEATQKAVEKERTGEYQTGTSQSVSAMFGLDEAARRQTIQSYASEYYTMTDAERALNKFEADRTNKEARNKLAQFLNVDEAAVRDMDNEKLDEAFDKRKQEVQDKFMDFIKGSFQMDNITNLNDLKAGIDALNGEAKESAQAMYDSIMFFMNMMHMAVDESGQIIGEDTFDWKEYTEDLSGRNTRQQAQADLLQLYKDVQAGNEISLTEEQAKSISSILSTQAAKNAIDKIADRENLTDADIAALRDSSDFLNAVSPDDQYQIANRFFNSIFGTGAVERMAAGQYTPTENLLQDEELFNNPDLLNVLSLYGKEGSAFSEAFSTYQKDRSKENLDALTRAYIDLGSQMDKTANIEKNKLGKSTEYVETQLKKLRGTTKEVIEAEKEFNTAMTQVNDNQYYRDQWKKGDRGSKTLASIQQQTGIDTQQLSKGTYNKTILDNMLNLQETEDKQVIQDWVNIKAKEILQSFQDEINNLSDEEKIELEGIDIEIKEGQFSASGLENVSENVASVISNVVSQLNATFDGVKFQGMLDGQWDGDVYTLIAKTISSITSTMPHGGGGGGGGGGKTATDKLIDKLKNRLSDVDHQIKMVQYAETRYQNRGELTNYMNALRTEDIYQADKQSVLEDNIKQMKAHMATLKKDSDEWRKAYEALKNYEEQLAQVINTREDLDKKIKDTKKQILQTTIDLQDRLAELLEAEETKRRSVLAGTVSMEQTILDTIRNRYQEEWELVERDLDKKREALQEEMALIDERLQRRKDAEDEAEKYEELAEYQRQLAFVSMDPTRSKDAAELRQKIADLQKDISWDLADKQAQAAKDDLQDQMDAYDKFKTRGQEDLQAFLEDANNMAEELKKIMSGSKDDIIAWLKANNVEYKNATDNARKQMIDSWTDTYNDMAGITITYWKQVKAIMAGDLKGAIDLLKNSDQYKNATTQMQQKMVGDLTDIWDNWTKAHKNSNNDDTHNDDDVTKGGKKNTNTNPGTNPGKNPVDGKDVSTIKDAVTKFRGDFQKLDNNTQKWLQVVSDKLTQQVKNGSNLFDLFKNASTQIPKTGGKSNQLSLSETSFDAKDTKLMRLMLDSMSKVNVPSLWAYLDPDKFSDASQTIGTVNIEINEASFADDADLDEVAREVGRRFTQELERNGMNVTNYSF